MKYDVIVLGLGGMGSAAAASLARRGARVLGLEQFTLNHHRGSSHGRTRIIRTAYFEHPDYVPLVQSAFSRWADLESRLTRALLTPCPCLCVGDETSNLIHGVNRSAGQNGLPVETLSSVELQKRYPQFVIPDRFVGVLEQTAGILAVEKCVAAQLADASYHGAELHSEEPVMEWKAVGNGIEVRTTKGTYSAGRLVVTAGAWVTTLLRDLRIPLTVMRQVQWWFPVGQEFSYDRFPIFMLETPNGAFYGLPKLDEHGFKCARHYGAPEVESPEAINWTVEPGEDADVRRFLSTHLPLADSRPVAEEVCMYTLTPDRHFIIDKHPLHPQVAVACGFSGHGFKFTPVVGEMLADISLGGCNEPVPRIFQLARFGN